MEFRGLIGVRRSIREFQDKDVALPLIHEIIADGCEAPNGGNRQPWAYIIITDKDVMKRCSDESKRNILLEIEKNPVTSLARYKTVLQNKDYNVFYNAPCLIYIAGLHNIHSTTVDCALAASYLMLSATDRGLGTCWINLGSAIKDKALLEEIGLSDEYVIVAPIILGYPAKIPNKPPRNKPKILKVIQ
ncbi:MAG: nitroreductase family protein [Bacteroidales bacterium]|nr:nitroreductase family protein [Bacteroidales bacterium]